MPDYENNRQSRFERLTTALEQFEPDDDEDCDAMLEGINEMVPILRRLYAKREPPD
jgi:hypothetical protein